MIIHISNTITKFKALNIKDLFYYNYKFYVKFSHLQGVEINNFNLLTDYFYCVDAENQSAPRGYVNDYVSYSRTPYLRVIVKSFDKIEREVMTLAFKEHENAQLVNIIKG